MTTATIDDVIERTDTLLPPIAERAPQTERDRQIPQEPIHEIEAAKLNRSCTPPAAGLGLLAYDATVTLAQASGASSLFETNPMERFMGHAPTGTIQLIANRGDQADASGRVRLGMEPNGQMR
jgi:hypothetical protein